jgi:hypothetical protein
MTIERAMTVAAALSVAAACNRASPTAPGAPSSVTSLVLTCSPQAALAGELITCIATAQGSTVILNPDVTWSSSAPDVLVSLGIGLFMGKSDVQGTITAAYQGHTASAQLTATLQDALRATATAHQGSFQIGTTATVWLQGFYGVASADSGSLTIVVSDQNGAMVSSSTPLTVPRGGERYLISTTFTVPPGTTRVCRTGVLQIGSTTLTVIPAPSLVPCIDITP